jgi:hypothetical protein
MNTATLSFPLLDPEKGEKNLMRLVANTHPIEKHIIIQRERVFTTLEDDIGSNNFHRELRKLDFLCRKATQIIHYEHSVRTAQATTQALTLVSKIHAEVLEILGLLTA